MVPLAFAVRGARGTPILTLHGLASSNEHWRYFDPHYAATHRVVSWDYRGHGANAARTDGPLAIDAFADDAHDVLRAAIAGEPAIVVGLSFGVQVALELYRRHPDAVRALVLICGTAGRPFAHAPLVDRVRKPAAGLVGALAGQPILAAPLLGFLRTSIGRRVASELAYATGGAVRGACPREVLDELFGHVGGLSPRVIGEVTTSYLQHDAWDVLPTIRVPTLIIAADRDQLTPVATAERMRDAIPDGNARLVVFPGHSHLVQVEDPDGVHAAIDAFLADQT